MKKISKLLVLVLCFCFLVGCSSKPNNVSEQAYKVGSNAIKYIDQYLDGEIALTEAKDKLSGMDKLITYKTNDYKSEVMRSRDMNISILIGSLHTQLLFPKVDTSKVLELRNKLADYLGVKEK